MKWWQNILNACFFFFVILILIYFTFERYFDSGTGSDRVEWFVFGSMACSIARPLAKWFNLKHYIRFKAKFHKFSHLFICCSQWVNRFGVFCVCCRFAFYEQCLNRVKLFLLGITSSFPWRMSFLNSKEFEHLFKIQFRKSLHSFLPNKSIFNLCLEHYDREMSTLFELPSHRR